MCYISCKIGIWHSEVGMVRMVFQDSDAEHFERKDKTCLITFLCCCFFLASYPTIGYIIWKLAWWGDSRMVTTQKRVQQKQSLNLMRRNFVTTFPFCFFGRPLVTKSLSAALPPLSLISPNQGHLVTFSLPSQYLTNSETENLRRAGVSTLLL